MEMPQKCPERRAHASNGFWRPPARALGDEGVYIDNPDSGNGAIPPPQPLKKERRVLRVVGSRRWSNAVMPKAIVDEQLNDSRKTRVGLPLSPWRQSVTNAG